LKAIYIILIILGILCLIFALLALRAASVKDESEKGENYQKPNIDLDRAVKKVQGAIRIPTVSMQHEGDSDEPFLDLHNYLKNQFPLFNDAAQRKIVNKYAVMYKLDGTDKTLKPACFLGHQDVVPANEKGWEHPPFEAYTDDEYIWGRGSFDMKSQLISMLEAIEIHLEKGHMPKRTMYFCFGHDEEFSGRDGATAMANVLRAKGVKMEFIFDEGMTPVNASVIGFNGPLCLVGVCEKGYANIKITSKGKGGHAAMPPKTTTAVEIAKAVEKINRHQMKAHFTEPVKMLIKKVCPKADFKFKLLMANSDIFMPILKPVLVNIDPSVASLLRTTMAITVLQASPAANVIPQESFAIINCRTNIGETSSDVKNHIQKVIGRKYDVEILNKGLHEPTSMSNLDSFGWKMMEKTSAEIFPGSVTAPFPFVAGTDSKYYEGLSDCIFKFSPHVTDAAYRAGMHNVNEKFKISDLEGDIQFYYRFMENSCM
jgi:carboxypeptidase PM20D1